MCVAFWVYCVLATVFSLGIYLIIWSTQHFTIAQMTPVSHPTLPTLLMQTGTSDLLRRTDR